MVEFFGFVVVHTVSKDDSEKCQTIEGLKSVELTNIANFILDEPMTIEMFIKNRYLDSVALEYVEKGLDLFIECLTLRGEGGSKVLKEGEFAGKPISEVIDAEGVFVADHIANVVQLP